MKLIAFALAAVLPVLAAGPEINKAKTLGNLGAPVQIEVFSDFECPICRVFHEQTLPQIMRDFVTTGKVCVVSREFPLNNPTHKFSRQAANYATAAARVGRYDQVAGVLFHNQESWGQSGKVWDAVASALTAEQQKKVQSLAADPSVLAEVQADVSWGNANGVNSTPSLFFVRGARRIPVNGSMSYSLMKSLIDDLLK